MQGVYKIVNNTATYFLTNEFEVEFEPMKPEPTW